MAQKIRPLRRSLVTHERNIKPNERMNEFIDNLFQGKIDDDIDQMMSHVPADVLNPFPPIDSLIEEMANLVKGENLSDDLIALNQFINHHDQHPQSLRLLQAVAHGLNGKLSDDAVEAFHMGITRNIRR